MAALALAASPVHAQEPALAGRVIDRAVAMIDGRVLTLSELEFETRVALIRGGGVQAATAPLDEATLRSALELAIGERLEAAEAEKLQAYPLEDGELEAALDAFRQRFPGPAELQAFLSRHEADVPQLASVIGRSLRAAKVLDGKLKLRAQVTEAEVKRFYEERGAGLGRYEEARATIRQRLATERLKKLTLDELASARKTADVRLLAPFAVAPR